jgi:hypothetical protein
MKSCFNSMFRSAQFTGAIALAAAIGVGFGYCAPASATSISPQSNQVTQASELQSNAEKFVDAMAIEDWEMARQFLNPLFRDQWAIPMMQQNWQDWQASAGVFQERLGSTVDGNIVSVSVQFGEIKNDLIVIFDDTQKIVGIDFPQVKTLK